MSGRPWWAVEPCGTEAAARRHYRHHEPVDRRCLDAQARAREARVPGGYEGRRERYAAARAAGMTRAEAMKARNRT